MHGSLCVDRMLVKEGDVFFDYFDITLLEKSLYVLEPCLMAILAELYCVFSCEIFDGP